MPGTIRKLVVFAAVDGLVLQPAAQRHQRPTQGLRIAYVTNKIVPLGVGSRKDTAAASFDSHGIVGIRSFWIYESATSYVSNL